MAKATPGDQRIRQCYFWKWCIVAEPDQCSHYWVILWRSVPGGWHHRQWSLCNCTIVVRPGQYNQYREIIWGNVGRYSTNSRLWRGNWCFLSSKYVKKKDYFKPYTGGSRWGKSQNLPILINIEKSTIQKFVPDHKVSRFSWCLDRLGAHAGGPYDGYKPANFVPGTRALKYFEDQEHATK